MSAKLQRRTQCNPSHAGSNCLGIQALQRRGSGRCNHRGMFNILHCRPSGISFIGSIVHALFASPAFRSMICQKLSKEHEVSAFPLQPRMTRVSRAPQACEHRMGLEPFRLLLKRSYFCRPTTTKKGCNLCFPFDELFDETCVFQFVILSFHGLPRLSSA
jgi:hypothetical protein